MEEFTASSTSSERMEIFRLSKETKLMYKQRS
jgi:hypothetical protein